MSFLPKKKTKAGPSALERFRNSPVYRILLRKQSKDRPLVASDFQQPANLAERAALWLFRESAQSDLFCTAMIARMVEAGLDRAIVDVVDEGPQCTVFMSDRLGEISKQLPSLMAEIAMVEMVAKPSDQRNGMFTFEIAPKDGVDFQQFLTKLIKKKNTAPGHNFHESKDPCFIPRRTV